MCYHNSINTDKQHLERKYKKKLNEQQQIFTPIHHASGFEFGKWPVITAESEQIEQYNWGLVPHWSKSYIDINTLRSQTLNARIETLSEKASFKNAKRCLISSTGFFEWQTQGKQKIPYFISLKNEAVFSFAGIYDEWINQIGEKMYSFSIVTTEANVLMAEIHNIKKRMPVILTQDLENEWLNSQNASEMFSKPFEENHMQAYTISNVISTKEHNTPKVTEPQTIIVPEQLNLF